MGLFNKKKKVEKSPTQIAATLAKDRGDYCSYFRLTYKDEVEAWENLITSSRTKSKEADSPDKELGALQETKSLLDGFHAWCKEREYGEQFFQFSYNNGDRSMYKRVEEEMEKAKKKLSKA